jgi:hypothetical protein
MVLLALGTKAPREARSTVARTGSASQPKTVPILCLRLVEPLIRTRAEAATYVTAAIAALS